jgi:hypothetical protein
MKLAEVWAYIMSSFASQSRTRVINVHMALSMTKKNVDMPVSKYVTKMKTLADEMTFTGKKLDDEDFVSYIFAGLESDFDPVISVISAISLVFYSFSWKILSVKGKPIVPRVLTQIHRETRNFPKISITFNVL